MTKYQLLKINASLITFFKEHSVNISDLDNIPIYEEYLEMKEQNLKKSYIVVCLADKYHLSERAVYKIIGRLEAVV